MWTKWPRYSCIMSVAHRAGCLSVTTMNVGFGGKQAIPHPSKMTEGGLGQGARLAVGDIHFFYFRTADENGGVADSPSWFKPSSAPSECLGKAKGRHTARTCAPCRDATRRRCARATD